MTETNELPARLRMQAVLKDRDAERTDDSVMKPLLRQHAADLRAAAAHLEAGAVPHLDNDKLLKLAETHRPPPSWYGENMEGLAGEAASPAAGDVCPRCNGNGRVELLEHCPVCKGSGKSSAAGEAERVAAERLWMTAPGPVIEANRSQWIDLIATALAESHARGRREGCEAEREEMLRRLPVIVERVMTRKLAADTVKQLIREQLVPALSAIREAGG